MNKRTALKLALLAATALVLAGCIQIRQEITLKPGEKWDVAIDLTVPASTVQLIGEDQLKSSEQDWEQQRVQYEDKGVQAQLTVKKQDNGDYLYSVTMAGQGWDLLNETAFDNNVTIRTLENQHVVFELDPGTSDLSSFTQIGGSLTFVVRAPKIYSANGEIKGNTVTWVNPTSVMQAEVGTEGGGSAGWIIGLVVLGVVVLLVVVVVLLYLRGRRLRQPPAPMPPVAPPNP
ncbi:MAG: hypothetical protein ACP5SI_03395 [Chloroflexia bacterium]